MEAEFLTTGQVAQRPKLNVTTQTVISWENRGLLKAVRVGWFRMFRLADVEQFEQQYRQKRRKIAGGK